MIWPSVGSTSGVREVAQPGYAYVLKPLRDQLGQPCVQDLTGASSSVRPPLAIGMSHRTIVYTEGAIHQVLAHGITQGLIAINVTASAKAPRKQHSDSRPWDRLEPAELITFRAVADQDEWAAALRLTMCGLHRSEVLGLTWD